MLSGKVGTAALAAGMANMEVEQMTAETVAMTPALRAPREVCAPGSLCADFMMTSSIRGARLSRTITESRSPLGETLGGSAWANALPRRFDRTFWAPHMEGPVRGKKAGLP